jgi:CheY-like chemotaxis protein
MPNKFENDDASLILVVDDDVVLRTALVRILRSEGHRVLDAATGPDALALIRSERPSLVIMDELLHGMDGEMVLRTVRAELGDEAPQMILVTTSPREAERARELGALMGLCKPFRVEDVLDIAEQFRAITDTAIHESGIIRLTRSEHREFDLDGALLRAVAEAG